MTVLGKIGPGETPKPDEQMSYKLRALQLCVGRFEKLLRLEHVPPVILENERKLMLKRAEQLSKMYNEGRRL